MNKAVFACLFSFALAFPLAANADDDSLRFDGGIGHSRCAPAVW